jgi:hypothetical protein
MRSKDVAELYAQLPLGALVQIVTDHLPPPKNALVAAPPTLTPLPNDKLILVKGEKTPPDSSKKALLAARGRGV